ncbi:rRNA-processing protein CGR1 [Ceratocystis lukuohia]|uniref:rRNA-processing protein n=3 Tax=Ceratocystis TaxID=5157 RepID=A0A0F8CSK8_CERFI|nr:rRNA-processing protein cgrA [Ceratocystis platani]PHH50340.1 rRNA-processing protein CGR1 [Ceratocystis fimbriata CBS 114723]
MSGEASSLSTVAALPAAAATTSLGMRKNGKQWHETKKAFRPGGGLTSYEKRAKQRVEMAAMKAKEKEMKEEKEEERQRRIQAIRDRREAKAERERFAQLEAKMHRKRVERLKRKEKRNKLIHS